MKIIFLNAWRGKVAQLQNFILENISSTDVFCFQEAGFFSPKIFCQDYLDKDYQLFTDEKPLSPKDIIVQATFIKKSISVLKTTTLAKDQDNLGLGLFTQIKNSQNKIFNILNFHGFPWPGDKQDNPDRIKQSQTIIDFFKKIKGPKIIGGDFNLDLNIKSVSLFEENGYRNLIKEFHIGNTRNQLSWQRYPDSKQYFADHLFISPDFKITYFAVPYIEISDHLPLILELNYQDD